MACMYDLQTGVRKRMMTERSVKNYHKKCHLSNNNGSTDDVLTFVDNSNRSTTFFGESLETLNESNAINQVTSKDDVTSFVEFPHMNQRSMNFFRQQHVTNRAAHAEPITVQEP